VNAERTIAYRRVLATLADLGPAKLHSSEQERIREAADALIFCGDLGSDDSAKVALLDAELLCDDLVESGRWQRGTAVQLAAAIRGCGPDLAVTLKAA
jgi:hypothetical protein